MLDVSCLSISSSLTRVVGWLKTQSRTMSCAASFGGGLGILVTSQMPFWASDSPSSPSSASSASPCSDGGEGVGELKGVRTDETTLAMRTERGMGSAECGHRQSLAYSSHTAHGQQARPFSVV